MKAWTLHWAARALVVGASGFLAALLAAVVLAVADLYVTGHGGPSLARPWLSWSPVVELSRADVVLWAVTLMAVVVAVFATGDLLKPPVSGNATLFLD